MSELWIKVIQNSKFSFLLLIIVINSLFLASCGSGSEAPTNIATTVRSSDRASTESTTKALAVSGSSGMVVEGWTWEMSIQDGLYKSSQSYVSNQYWVVPSSERSSGALQSFIKSKSLVIMVTDPTLGYLIETDNQQILDELKKFAGSDYVFNKTTNLQPISY